ncbi:adhesin/hemolysin precursor [Candidatus Brocadia pituitae]|nr:adhesin/hemolysin precursor [Candidatus Brocadia pituitae]
MKIPNADRAVLDIRKLRDYCLNLFHDEGKHKARLLEGALGITANDAEQVRNFILYYTQDAHKM